MADFNGDGHVDVIAYGKENPQDFASLRIAFGDGLGNFSDEGVEAEQSADERGSGPPVVGEFGGDDRPDVAIPAANGLHIQLNGHAPPPEPLKLKVEKFRVADHTWTNDLSPVSPGVTAWDTACSRDCRASLSLRVSRRVAHRAGLDSRSAPLTLAGSKPTAELDEDEPKRLTAVAAPGFIREVWRDGDRRLAVTAIVEAHVVGEPENSTGRRSASTLRVYNPSKGDR